jgi:hypothetical protein
MNYPPLQLPLDQGAPDPLLNGNVPSDEDPGRSSNSSIYSAIRFALLLVIAYFLVQKAGELVSHISWDMLGIGLALFLPVAYMIAVARREPYGE